MWQPWLSPKQVEVEQIEVVEIDESRSDVKSDINVKFYSEDAQQIILNVYEGLQKKCVK